MTAKMAKITHHVPIAVNFKSTRALKERLQKVAQKPSCRNGTKSICSQVKVPWWWCHKSQPRENLVPCQHNPNNPKLDNRY